MRQLFNLITTPSLDAATTDQRLKQLLEHNGIQIEGSIVQEVVYHLADLLEVTWDKGENDEITREAEQRIKDWLMVLLEQGAGPKQTGKIGKFISNRMFGGMCGAMKLELAKYEFATSVEGKEVGLTFSISKRRGHAIAGLNSGVCVSLDNQLWAKKTFTNVILWNDEISAEGGMHFETIVDNGKKYLSLPGINPSHKILQRVNPDDLYKEMIEYAKKAAEAIGAAGVLIPISKGIHSNRQAIQEIVARQNYPRYRLKMEHDFSYDPYPYSWQEAYFIPVESEFLSMGEEAGDEYEDIQSSFEPRGRRGSSNGATPRAQEIAQENGYFQVKLDKFKTPRLGHRLGDLLGKKETRS